MILKHSNNPKISFFKNSFYLYLSHFADYFFSLLFLPFIAKTVGVIEFGKIGLVQTYAVFIVLILEFGSSMVATRQISRLKKSKKKLRFFINTITTFKICIIPLILFITLALVLTLPAIADSQFYFLIAALGAIFQGLSPTWFFSGIEKMKKIAISKIVFRFLGFISILIFVRSSNDAWIVLLSFSGSSLFICLYLYYQMKKIAGIFSFASPKYAISIFKESLHGFLITIFPVIYQNFSIFYLSLTISPLQLGVFYGANKIYKAFNALYGPLSISFFPIISSSSSSFEQKVGLYKKYFYLIFTVGLIFFGVNYFLSEKIIFLLLGSSFKSSAQVLTLFSFTLPLTAVSNSLGRQWLMANNKDVFYSMTQLVSSIIALIIFIFSFNHFGYKAYPISLIIFELTSIFIIAFLYIKTKKE